jgi:hypothetical protein
MDVMRCDLSYEKDASRSSRDRMNYRPGLAFGENDGGEKRGDRVALIYRKCFVLDPTGKHTWDETSLPLPRQRG